MPPVEYPTPEFIAARDEYLRAHGLKPPLFDPETLQGEDYTNYLDAHPEYAYVPESA